MANPGPEGRTIELTKCYCCGHYQNIIINPLCAQCGAYIGY